MREEFLRAKAELDKAIDSKFSTEAIDTLMKKAMEKSKALVSEKRENIFRAENDAVSFGSADKDIIRKSSSNEKVINFQRWNDEMYLVKKLMTRKYRSEGMRYDLRKSKRYQQGVSQHREILKVISGLNNQTTNQGYEWVPTQMSARLFDLVRLARRVPQLFEMIPMPTPTFTPPFVLTDLVAKKLAETTADDPTTRVAAGSPKTSSFTLTAVKMGIRVPYSDEINEDSIVAMEPLLTKQFAIAIASGQESCIIKGDITAKHMDSDVTASDDVNRCWKGLRKHCLANSYTTSAANNYLSDAYLMAAQVIMEKYGVNPLDQALLVSPRGYISGRQAITQIRTKDLSDQATIENGIWTKWGGVPVIPTEFMQDDLDETGINQLTTKSYTAAVLVNHRAWVLGERRKVTIRAFEDVVNEQMNMTVTWRGDFQSIFGSTAKSASMLYYVKNGKS
jgi:HK97 family phage major capsid protein